MPTSALRRGGGVRSRLRGRRAVLGGFISLDRIIDFTTMDGDLLRGFHAQSHFVASNLDDDNRDVIVDDDAFVLLPRQHQHDDNPFVVLAATGGSAGALPSRSRGSGAFLK